MDAKQLQMIDFFNQYSLETPKIKKKSHYIKYSKKALVESLMDSNQDLSK